jgi:iron only hydrogenase large subunit-like protein
VKELLKDIPNESSYTLIEPLFCSQGCINGPGISMEKNLFERRKDIIRYDREIQGGHEVPDLEDADLFTAVL